MLAKERELYSVLVWPGLFSFGQEGVREATSRRTWRDYNIFVLFVFLFSGAWHCAWHIEHAYQCCRKEKESKRERRERG